jgi:hypothetical protein
MATESILQRQVREILDAEVASGYPLVRRIPSTYTWKIMDYVSTLEPAERDALFTAFAGNGVFLLRPNLDRALHAYAAGHPAYRRFVEAMPRISDWKYVGVRMLRGILGDLRSSSPSPEFAAVPAELIQRAETIRPITAAAIRREIKRLFGQRFAARGENRGGGTWRYAGEFRGQAFQVDIDYGSRSDQLCYGLSLDDPANALRARRLTYEGLIGLGHGQWDFVHADNLGESVNLLADLVAELVVLCAAMGRASDA